MSQRCSRSRLQVSRRAAAAVGPAAAARGRLCRAVRRATMEMVEPRQMLSASLVNVPNWTEQGPGPVNASGFQQIGAVEEVAPAPGNANLLYAATVNGGVWKTTNATAATPTWTPLTDQFPVLSMSAIAISPLDAGNNTVYAGTGLRSSGGFDGATPNGLLRTTDGGATWTMLGQSTFAGRTIRSVVPMNLGTSVSDQVVIVASTSGGIFRSTNGGSTFTQVSGSSGLPAGGASFAARDAGNDNRVYACLPGKGVFRSDDGGATWAAANGTGTTAIPSTALTGSTRIEVAIHNSAGNNVLYAVALQTGVAPTTSNFTERVVGVFRSLDQGTTWRTVQNLQQPIPNGQGAWHLAFAADPTSPNRFFIDGDVSGGFRVTCDDATPANDNWAGISGANSGGTSPHADSRDMKFDANNNLLEGDDGGIYRLINPNTPATRVWVPVQGTLHNSEFYSLAYDSLNNVLFGGLQDNGTPAQTIQNSTAWSLLEGGDGADVMIDNDQTAHPGQVIRYTSSQNLGGFRRQTFNNANTPVGGPTNIPMVVNGTGGRTITGLGTFASVAEEDLDDPEAEDLGDTVFDNTVGFIQPYVLNAVDPNRFLIGDNFLYETTNQGATFNANWGLTDLTNNGVDDDSDGVADPDPDEWRPANGLGVSAMAYGGRLGGVANPNIIFVGAGGKLRLRTAITNNDLTDFPIVTAYPGSSPVGIALDPDNWQRGYILDSSNRVWQFSNAGAAAADWTNLTGNLSGAGGLTNDTRTLALVTPTSAAGDDFIVVGGLGGVFRAAPNGSGTPLWTEVGSNMPNTIVKALHWDATDNVLIAGTWGRGAFTLANASAVLAGPGVLQITGDTDFPGEDDTIKLVRNASNPTLLDVYLNSAAPTLEVPMSSLQQINVNSLAGKDTLIVDSSFGLISVAGGIRYDGGAQTDTLVLTQTAGAAAPTVIADQYSVGPDIGQGSSVISAAAAVQTVQFDNLEPVVDTVPAPLLSVTATAEANAISYTAGSVAANGKVLIDNYESIEFSNKAQATIDASFGNDTVNLGNGSAPAGLTRLNVLGGDGADEILASAGPVSVALNVDAGTGDDAVDTSAAAANTTVAGQLGDDTITTGGGDDSVTGGDGADVLFAGAGFNTVSGGNGSDTYFFAGTDSGDTMSALNTGSALTTILNASAGTSQISTLENVRVEAGNGSDNITIHPSIAGGLAYTVAGGDPTGAPGDTLTVDSPATVSFTPGPTSDSGSFVVATGSPTDISFTQIEALSVTGGGALNLAGTNGADTITLTARDGSFNGAADGVQDFTVSVNGSPTLLFINTPAVGIDALGGNDLVDLIVVAPNNAAWGTTVNVDAGPPADNDKVVVETPGAGAEAVAYTPSGADAGSLTVTGAGTTINLLGAEQLLYDGRSDNDSLTFNGVAAGDDAFVVESGPGNDAGSVRTNSLLGLSYQNLGAAPALNIKGNGGGDSATFNGTAAGDTFLVNRLAAGVGGVTVNSHFQVSTTDVATLIASGLGGDDFFNLTPSLSDSPYNLVAFVGGDNSLAGSGDRAKVNGSAGDDGFTMQGSTLALAGKLVSYGGVENTDLDAGGGTDSIHVLSRDGVKEDFNVAASPTAGTGRIDVPGQFNVNFTSNDFVDVAGNAADNDTLAFFGTNNQDTFTIRSDAAGTIASPVLKLAPTSGAAALLTLTNYTGIQTLRVNALDGEDVINLFTGPTAGRNFLIDGGSPTGKKKQTDQLNIFYASPRPRIVQSTTTQSPQSGLVTLDYGTSFTQVQFADIEDFAIRKL